MPTLLICAPGTHSNLHISMLTEAMYYAGLLYLMGMLNYFVMLGNKNTNVSGEFQSQYSYRVMVMHHTASDGANPNGCKGTFIHLRI